MNSNGESGHMAPPLALPVAPAGTPIGTPIGIAGGNPAPGGEKKILQSFAPPVPTSPERVTALPETIRRDSNAAILRVCDIERDENQPRRVFADLESLAASIKTHGLINPILVRKKPGEAGKYIVIAGERRFQAHRLAGLDVIKARILDRDLGDRERRALQFAENNDRSALNMVEEGLFFAEEKEARGCSNRELARVLGVDKSYIDLRIRLLSLPEDIKEQIRAGKIDSPSAVYRLTKIDNEVELRQAVAGLMDGSIKPTALRRDKAEAQASAKDGAGATTSGASGGASGAKAEKKPAASAGPDKTKKRTIDGVTISVSSSKRVTYQQWKEALEKFITEEIDADGRTAKDGRTKKAA